MEDIIVCSNCSNSFDKETVRQKCSNCFACTGCEIYFCPFCGSEAILRLPKKISLNNGKSTNEGKGDKND